CVCVCGLGECSAAGAGSPPGSGVLVLARGPRETDPPGTSDSRRQMERSPVLPGGQGGSEQGPNKERETHTNKHTHKQKNTHTHTLLLRALGTLGMVGIQ